MGDCRGEGGVVVVSSSTLQSTAGVDAFENDSQLVRRAPSINPDSLETTPGAPCSWR
jgi:hypothetical protein